MIQGLKPIRALFPTLQLYPWAVPAIVGLGLLASLAEGIGISLFIPFLHDAYGEAGTSLDGNWFTETLGNLFTGIPDDQRLLVISACIVGSMLVKALLTFANGAVFRWLESHVGHILRVRTFDQLLSVGYEYLERRPFGEILYTLSDETWRTSEAFAAFLRILIACCTVLVYGALLLLLSWQLTLFVIAGLVVISLTVQLLMRHVQDIGRECASENALLGAHMLDGLSGMKIIRAFGQEQREQETFDAQSDKVSNIMVRLGLYNEAITPIHQVLAVGLLIVVLLVSLQGSGNLAVTLVFLAVLYRLQPRIKEIDSYRTKIDELTGSMENLYALLATDDKPYTTSGSQHPGALEEGIRFDGVTFRYTEDAAPALRDVSLALPAGKTTALVGPSGSGKSTVAKLILRFYDVDEGVVSVDEVPIQDLDLAAWRARITVVSQDIHVFDRSARANIAYGRPDATEEEITAAAKKADADAFIRALPDGYDTKLGEHGERLSNGQRQRLSLARALLCDPEILILDEATNAVDSLSEQFIQEALALHKKDRTVLIIAHRLYTVADAERIIVLEEGAVREAGTFDELLHGDGLFAQLYALQSEHRTPSSAR